MANSDQGSLRKKAAAGRRREKPPGGRLDSTVGVGGVPIRYGHWQPQGEQKGTCLLVQGRREFIEKYFETINDLLDRGYAVFTFDWRGQGRSVRLLDNRQKGHVDSFDDYLADLHRFMIEIVREEAKSPVMALAHSMGGHLLLRYAHEHRTYFSCLVLAAPMIAIRFSGIPLGVLKAVVHAACRAGMAKRYALFQHDYDDRCLRFESNPVTSDPDRFADEAYFVDLDPTLAMGGITYGWLKAAIESIETINAPRFAEGISLPILMIAGGQDRVVDNAAIKRFAKRLPRGQCVSIGDARHELLRESDPIRAMFWRLVDEFLEETGL